MSELLVRAVARRCAELDRALANLPDGALGRPSLLPDWSMLTIACHLRYGAEATRRMTLAVVAGTPAAFYPRGRGAARAATLEPRPGERPGDVIVSLRQANRALSETWAGLAPQEWGLLLEEPDDRTDLGPLPLSDLALLRLTEVEVHGTDLGLGLSDWSDEFVTAALPFRLRWLERRLHTATGRGEPGRWRVVSADGPSFTITATDDGTVRVQEETEPATAGADRDRASGPDTAVISGSDRDLVGFLLGRVSPDQLDRSVDRRAANRFLERFPPP